MLESQEQSNFHKLRIPKTDEWKIPKLQIIRYVKPSILERAYLVTGMY